MIKQRLMQLIQCESLQFNPCNTMQITILLNLHKSYIFWKINSSSEFSKNPKSLKNGSQITDNFWESDKN